MTTEFTFSNGRWPSVTEPRIRGYRHIYRLASMEGSLMAIAAVQRLTGDVRQTQIAFIAFEFVRQRYTERPELSASCYELATAVERLARNIDAAIEYEKGALTREQQAST